MYIHVYYQIHVVTVILLLGNNLHVCILLQLKQLGVETFKLAAFYTASIRYVNVYTTPAFYNYLTNTQLKSLESIQSTCTRRILPQETSYTAR